MVEYALMASFLVFATVAVVPGVITKVSQVMVGVYSNMCSAGGSCPAPINKKNDDDR